MFNKLKNAENFGLDKNVRYPSIYTKKYCIREVSHLMSSISQDYILVKKAHKQITTESWGIDS